jgi:hypothetical protein
MCETPGGWFYYLREELECRAGWDFTRLQLSLYRLAVDGKENKKAKVKRSKAKGRRKPLLLKLKAGFSSPLPLTFLLLPFYFLSQPKRP